MLNKMQSNERNVEKVIMQSLVYCSADRSFILKRFFLLLAVARFSIHTRKTCSVFNGTESSMR